MRAETATMWRDTNVPTTRPVPRAAGLADGPVGLVSFARRAGTNIFSVIPEETLRATYLRGPGNLHYVCDPEIITEILVGRGRYFPKSAFTKNVIGSAVGNGLILSEGAKWRAQRHRYSPLFAARNLPMLSQHFAATGLELAEAVKANPGRIDIADISQEATLQDISRVMFSGTEAVAPKDVRDALRAYTQFISHMSLFDLMGLPRWVPRRKWLRSRQPVEHVRALGASVIESRRTKRHAEPEDFLDLMIEALDSDFEDFDTTVDNLLTFVVAGYETAANTIAWGMYLLALNPDVQSEIRREVVRAADHGPITLDSIGKMPRLQSHVRETMRLYPAASLYARDTTEELSVKGITFRKGDAILLPIYSLHRNESLWEEPATYRPERFLGYKPPRGQFLPFGDGPRVCIGAQYAETEIMVLMASLVREVSFTLTEAEIPEPVLTFTMRPGGPIVLNAHPVVSGPA